MVDYTRGTGSGGTMLIRDLGWEVQFHLKSGQSSSWVGSPGFGTNAYTDGAWRGLPNLKNISGNPWVHLGSHNATYTQDVCFHIDASGTQGYGGPTDFWQRVDRAPAAGPPGKVPWVSATNIGHTSATLNWGAADLNNGAFEFYQLQTSSQPQSGYGDFVSGGIFHDTGSTTGGYTWNHTNMQQNVLWYSHVRVKTNQGWGQWSDIITYRTLTSARVKAGGVWVDAVPFVKINGVWREAVAFAKIAGVWTASK